MVSCINIKGKKRKICAGDLNNRIGIFERSLEGNVSKKLQYDTNFLGGDVVSAMILTKSGSQIIDGVAITVRPTHEFYIRFRSDVSDSSHWIIYKGVIYDIIEIENLEERDEFLKIRCVKKGTNLAAGGNASNAQFAI